MKPIDYHAHFIPPECADAEAVTDGGRRIGSRRDLEAGEVWIEGRLRQLGTVGFQPWMQPSPNPLWMLSERVAFLDAAGIARQVLSVPPYLCLYEARPDDTWRLARRLNEAMARATAGHPRFVGFATVPLQEPQTAALELRFAVEQLSLAGVEILTHVGGRHLDEPEFAAFWAAVSELDVPVFLHPHTPPDPARWRRYYMSNLLGNPTETALAVGHLIFGGVIDRFPNLRFVLAHAGGSLPSVFGRWEHGVRELAELRVLQKPLRTYLKSFYLDTVAHDAKNLEFVIRFAGPENVVIGTDYPYDMGDLQPLKSLSAVPRLGEAALTTIADNVLFKERQSTTTREGEAPA